MGGMTGLSSSSDPIGRFQGVNCRAPSTTHSPRLIRTGERTNRQNQNRNQKTKQLSVVEPPVLLIGGRGRYFF